jgi:hypothetical protein
MNLKYFFKLWATKTSAAVRAKKYPEKSAGRSFLVDLISKIWILSRFASTASRLSKSMGSDNRTMSNALPYTTMSRLAKATTRFFFCFALGTKKPAFFAIKTSAARLAVPLPLVS